jgi:hypothetical protein
MESQDEEEVIQSRPMFSEGARKSHEPHEPQAAHEVRQPSPPRPEPTKFMATPAIDRTQLPEVSSSTRRDPNYEPSSSPRSKR